MLVWGDPMEYLKKNYFPIVIICAACIGFALWLSNSANIVPASSEALEGQRQIVIDAGHGGVDGGAVSCTGIYESQINLEIALRLDDMCHLLGRRTVMVRTQDVSLHGPDATTIAQKKVSDLRNRVQLVNDTQGAILVSIHQNHFSQSKYHGAQVFYAPTESSEDIAKLLQDNFRILDASNNRTCKPADSVYLLSKIQCPGILVECGFLSNAQEELQLRDAEYQKKLAVVIAGSIHSFMQKESNENEI